MNKKVVLISVVILIAGAGFYFLSQYKQVMQSSKDNRIVTSEKSKDDGNNVALSQQDKNGLLKTYIVSEISDRTLLLSEVKELIKNGADVNAREEDDEGKVMLMMALNAGNYDIARELIAAGANINAKDNNGQPVLLYAIVKGNIDMIKDLIKAGVNVSDSIFLDGEKIDNGIIIYSIITGKDEIVTVLKGAGAILSEGDLATIKKLQSKSIERANSAKQKFLDDQNNSSR